jgi:hypothetical protein
VSDLGLEGLALGRYGRHRRIEKIIGPHRSRTWRRIGLLGRRKAEKIIKPHGSRTRRKIVNPPRSRLGVIGDRGRGSRGMRGKA